MADIFKCYEQLNGGIKDHRKLYWLERKAIKRKAEYYSKVSYLSS